MSQPLTSDVIDDVRRFTDADIRSACHLIDALDGDQRAALDIIAVVQRLRDLVREQTR